jgi:hypothetical protein
MKTPGIPLTFKRGSNPAEIVALLQFLFILSRLCGMDATSHLANPVLEAS